MVQHCMLMAEYCCDGARLSATIPAVFPPDRPASEFAPPTPPPPTPSPPSPSAAAAGTQQASQGKQPSQPATTAGPSGGSGNVPAAAIVGPVVGQLLHVSTVAQQCTVGPNSCSIHGHPCHHVFALITCSAAVSDLSCPHVKKASHKGGVFGVWPVCRRGGGSRCGCGSVCALAAAEAAAAAGRTAASGCGGVPPGLSAEQRLGFGRREAAAERRPQPSGGEDD